MTQKKESDEVSVDSGTISADEGEYSLFDDGPDAEDIIQRLGIGTGTQGA